MNDAATRTPPPPKPPPRTTSGNSSTSRSRCPAAGAGHNYVAPIVAGLAIFGFGTLAERRYTRRAWDHVPRKRQDRERPLSASWDLAAAGVLAAVLGVAVVPGATALAYALWFGADGPSVAEVGWGAVTMTACAAVVGASRWWDRRRHPS